MMVFINTNLCSDASNPTICGVFIWTISNTIASNYFLSSLVWYLFGSDVVPVDTWMVVKTSDYIINTFQRFSDLWALREGQWKLLGDLMPSVISHYFLSFFTSLLLCSWPTSFPFFYLTSAFPTAALTPLLPLFPAYILVSLLAASFSFLSLLPYTVFFYFPQSLFLTCSFLLPSLFLFFPTSVSPFLPHFLSFPFLSIHMRFSLPTTSFPSLLPSFFSLLPQWSPTFFFPLYFHLFFPASSFPFQSPVFPLLPPHFLS